MRSLSVVSRGGSWRFEAIVSIHFAFWDYGGLYEGLPRPMAWRSSSWSFMNAIEVVDATYVVQCRVVGSWTSTAGKAK
jgi:hypothetical protein